MAVRQITSEFNHSPKADDSVHVTASCQQFASDIASNHAFRRVIYIVRFNRVQDLETALISNSNAEDNNRNKNYSKNDECEGTEIKRENTRCQT
jgi:hypothetical protein